MFSRPSRLFSALLFASSALAQGALPDYLTQQREQNKGGLELEVFYGSNQVVDEIQEVPQFALCDSCGISTFDRYIIAMIDLDLRSSNNSVPQYLHYLRTNFSISDATALNSSSPPEIPFTPPAPREGSGPHRYVWVMYNQPRNNSFRLTNIPESDEARAEFNIQQWQTGNGFVDGPEWAVYLVAENGVQPTRTARTTSTTATSVASETGSTVTSTLLTLPPPTGSPNSTTRTGEAQPSETSNNDSAAGKAAGVSVLAGLVGFASVMLSALM
ncbi:hypothetical protein BDZ91DRAFT_221848 [Kalaharituber pfeilii]|nr:hypothetical protein BDZ91DRAFT_221848 [Kalaharituber pfeilii]